MGVCLQRQAQLSAYEMKLQQMTQSHQSLLDSLMCKIDRYEMNLYGKYISCTELYEYCSSSKVDDYENRWEIRSFLTDSYNEENKEFQSSFKPRVQGDKIFWYLEKNQGNKKDLDALLNLYSNHNLFVNRKLHINISNKIDSSGQFKPIKDLKWSSGGLKFLETNLKVILLYQKFTFHMVHEKSSPLYPYNRIDIVNVFPDGESYYYKDQMPQFYSWMKIQNSFSTVKKIFRQNMQDFMRQKNVEEVLDICSNLSVSNSRISIKAQKKRVSLLKEYLEDKKQLLLEALLQSYLYFIAEPDCVMEIEDLIKELDANKLIQEYENQGKWGIIGGIEMAQGNYQKAIDYFEKESNPTFHECILKAKAYYILENYPRALISIQNHIQDSCSYVYFLYAKINKQLGKENIANKFFERGLAVSIKRKDIHYKRAVSQVTQESYDYELATNNSAQQQQNNYFSKRQKLLETSILEQFECYDEMILKSNQVFELFPDSIDALLNKAKGYIKTERYVISLNVLNDCLKLNNTCMKMFQYLSLCYNKLNQPELATKALNSMLEIYPRTRKDISIKQDYLQWQEEIGQNIKESMKTLEQNFILSKNILNIKINNISFLENEFLKMSPEDIFQIDIQKIPSPQEDFYQELGYFLQKFNNISEFSLDISDFKYRNESCHLDLSPLIEQISNKLTALKLNFNFIKLKDIIYKQLSYLLQDKLRLEILDLNFSSCSMQESGFNSLIRMFSKINTFNKSQSVNESQDQDINFISNQQKQAVSIEQPYQISAIDFNLHQLGLRQLYLDLSKNQIGNKQIIKLGESIKHQTSLTVISINFSENNIEFDGAIKFILLLSNLVNLQALKLDLSRNELSNQYFLSKSRLRSISNSKSTPLELHKQGLWNIQEYQRKPLRESLNKLVNLKKLILDCSNSLKKQDSYVSLFDSILELKNLTFLTLYIQNSLMIDDAAQSIRYQIKRMQSLEKFYINFYGTQFSINAFNQIFKSLYELPNLKHLSLGLKQTSIGDIDLINVADSIKNIKGLEYLSLQLNRIYFYRDGGNKFSKNSLQKIIQGISELDNLQVLQLNLSNHYLKDNICDICETILKLKKISSLILSMSDCSIGKKCIDLAEALSDIVNQLQRLEVDLSSNYVSDHELEMLLNRFLRKDISCIVDFDFRNNGGISEILKIRYQEIILETEAESFVVRF